MIERLRQGLWRLGQRLTAVKCGGRKKSAIVPIKGNVQNIIVVKPSNKMFSQAVFVLSDEYLRQSRLSSQELLRQAREAAGEYSGLISFPSRPGTGLKTVLVCLAAASFLFVAYYFIFM